jgi:hypothetical protein
VLWNGASFSKRRGFWLLKVTPLLLNSDPSVAYSHSLHIFLIILILSYVGAVGLRPTVLLLTCIYRMRKVNTELLPSNERLLLLHYSGLQMSCHIAPFSMLFRNLRGFNDGIPNGRKLWNTTFRWTHHAMIRVNTDFNKVSFRHSNVVRMVYIYSRRDRQQGDFISLLGFFLKMKKTD